MDSFKQNKKTKLLRLTENDFPFFLYLKVHAPFHVEYPKITSNRSVIMNFKVCHVIQRDFVEISVLVGGVNAIFWLFCFNCSSRERRKNLF